MHELGVRQGEAWLGVSNRVAMPNRLTSFRYSPFSILNRLTITGKRKATSSQCLLCLIDQFEICAVFHEHTSHLALFVHFAIALRGLRHREGELALQKKRADFRATMSHEPSKPLQ